jgi:hypothetical protein
VEEYTPCDDFAPFGYLDNPYHAWRLNPSGVLRSRPPAGMGWHVPNYGSYARNQFRGRLHLHVGLEADGHVLLQPADFRAAGVTAHCDLHTAHRLRYTFEHPAGITVAATYFLVNEHTLGCRITLERARTGASDDESHPLALRLWLAQEVAHNPTTSRDWEHGLYALPPGNSDPLTGGAGLLGVCPEGDAWAHGLATAAATATDLEDAAARALLMPAETRATTEPWEAGAEDILPRDRDADQLQTAVLALAYDLELAPGVPLALDAALARGPGADQVIANLGAALAESSAALAASTAADERFWAAAPRLSGDWPAHFRRGFALDQETLRMVARPPAGVFARRWDGMQIQAPRSVLAETALDALALSWADPALARELLLSCFAAAPRPNVPCQREDGSYNMVADDGSICGTGPAWGWPFAVVDALWRRSGDRAWLAAIYPHAAAYLAWWLTQRVDAAGWLVHACSWESGQDVSTRFGTQATGGSDIRSVRPVDLHAAAAQAASLLSEWARELELGDDQRTRWAAVAEDLAAKTRAMWRANWFFDYDAVASRWSRVRDPMQLAPLAAGLANAQQRQALRRTFGALPRHCGTYPPLVWPPVAQTALEAALAVGLEARAGELAGGILDRVWRRLDARRVEPDGALPGITREYWPEDDERTSAGIEGYGWGALTIHFLVRYLLGLREEAPHRLRLVPALPPLLRRHGANFTAGPLPYGACALTLTYAIAASSESVAITLEVAGAIGPVVVCESGTHRELARATPGQASTDRVSLHWHGIWGRAAIIELGAPTAASPQK